MEKLLKEVRLSNRTLVWAINANPQNQWIVLTHTS